MNIADRIQNLRKSKGISQEELADKIGVSRQAVSKWESEQSIPDIDKIIIMSNLFDVTTDYILKGIENENQAVEDPVDASIFTIVGTVFNFIGLVVSWAVWYEEQELMALAIGLIIMAVGCMVFGIGQVSSTQNVYKARRNFLTINIWLLTFIPLSAIYNMLFSRIMAPYPLLVNPLIAFSMFWIVYIAVCLVVVFIQLKLGRKK